jgi:anti-sigma regulatory factor (Ser/Thr protein kinase)
VIRREERTFELDPGEVASARRFVTAVLKRWGCDSSDVILAVGELASNAILHARTHFTVILSLAEETLTLGVADHNPRLPVAIEPPPGALSGRGLMLVRAVSRAWGVRAQTPDGKQVWAEFSLGKLGAASNSPPPASTT